MKEDEEDKTCDGWWDQDPSTLGRQMQITCALCPPLACARAIGGVTRYLAQEGGGGHTQGPIFSDPWHRDNRRKMEDTYDGYIYVCR